MQDFMQSLQMRWPVAAHIGLSMTVTASAPMGLPFCLTRFISEIFSSSGQPARVTPKMLVLEFARLFFEASGAAVFALVVALDAVVRFVEGTSQIHAGVGQAEAFAMAPVVRGQLVLRYTVEKLFDGHEVLHVELVGDLEEDAFVVLLLAGGVRVAQAAYWAARASWEAYSFSSESH
jgi:hypothetical protein